MPHPEFTGPHVNLPQLAKRVRLTKEEVKRVFDALLAYMEEGTQVRIRGFGCFTPIIRPAMLKRIPEWVRQARGIEKTHGISRAKRKVYLDINSRLYKRWERELGAGRYEIIGNMAVPLDPTDPLGENKEKASE